MTVEITKRENIVGGIIMKRLSSMILCCLLLSVSIFAGELLDGSYNYNTMDLDVPGKIYYAFDFGPKDAELAKGYIQITNETVFEAKNGYGWMETGSLIVRRTLTLQGDQARDMVASSDEGTFRVVLKPGRYRLTFIFNDINFRPSMNLWINNDPYLEKWSLPGLFMKVKYTEVELKEGTLDITLAADKDIWVINALVISEAKGLK